MNNNPIFSSLELVGGLSAQSLNWNNKSDLKVSGGFLVRGGLLSTGNTLTNKTVVKGQTVVYGSLKGSPGNLNFVGDLTPIDANVFGNSLYWDTLTVFGNVDTIGRTTFYDEDVQYALLGNCIIDDNENTMLCTNEDDTITWYVNGEYAATLAVNGGFKIGGNTSAIGDMSFAEGFKTNVSGKYSHVEGIGCVCDGDSSHMTGCHNVETNAGFANHTEGRHNTVSGKVNHVEGSFNNVTGNINTILVANGTKCNGDYVHAELKGPIVINSDTSHIEGQSVTNSGLGLDHLESHSGTKKDLQTIRVLGVSGVNSSFKSGLNHSDAGSDEIYLAGYCTSINNGMRSLTKDMYGSAIGSDVCVNQRAMWGVGLSSVDSSPFGEHYGTTFTTPINASVGHGHAQLSIFHIRGLTTCKKSGIGVVGVGNNGVGNVQTTNLSLNCPIIPEIYPQLKYKGNDTTVVNKNVLRQVWNISLTVVGKNQTLTSSCFGQIIHFVAIHDQNGAGIHIAGLTKQPPFESGNLSGSNVIVNSEGNGIRVSVQSNDADTVHWVGTMRVINSGVMDFTGNLMEKML